MLETFTDDDHGYGRWRWAHPHGYVISTSRPPSASKLTIHVANCPTISGDPPGGGTWTGSSMKVCAPTIDELSRWAHETVDADPVACGTCDVRPATTHPGGEDPARTHPGG